MKTFFEQFNWEKRKTETRPEQAPENRLIENLKLVINRLNEEESNGLKYSVVGGIALTAWSQQEYSPLRENKTFRDLDVIILDDPRNKLPSIENAIEKQRKSKEFLLPVDFNKTKPEEHRSKIQFLTHFKKGAAGHYLVFRNIEKQIPPELLERHQVNLKIGNETVNFKTFEPGTLLHLYIQRVGNLKLKDRNKIIKFLRENAALRKMIITPGEHKKYRVFHELAKELRKKYPIYNTAVKTYNLVDHVFFKSLISHKFIPKKLFRMLINL